MAGAAADRRSRWPRAGKYMALVPAPVVEGFTLGIACVIGLQQIPTALGVPKPEGDKVSCVAWRALQDFAGAPALDGPSRIALAVAAVMLAGRALAAHRALLAAGRGRRHRRRRELADLPVATIGDLPVRAARALPRPSSTSAALGVAARPGGRGRRAGRAGVAAVGVRRRRDERRPAARPGPGAVRAGPGQPRRPAVRRRPRHRRRSPAPRSTSAPAPPPGWPRWPTPRVLAVIVFAAAGLVASDPAGRAGRRAAGHRDPHGRGRLGQGHGPLHPRRRRRAGADRGRHPRPRPGLRRHHRPASWPAALALRAVARDRPGSTRCPSARGPVRGPHRARSTPCWPSTSSPTASTGRCSSPPPTASCWS